MRFERTNLKAIPRQAILLRRARYRNSTKQVRKRSCSVPDSITRIRGHAHSHRSQWTSNISCARYGLLGEHCISFRKSAQVVLSNTSTNPNLSTTTHPESASQKVASGATDPSPSAIGRPTSPAPTWTPLATHS